MFALLLVIGLFLFLTLVGQAVISLLRPYLGLLWSWFSLSHRRAFAPARPAHPAQRVGGIPKETAGPWLTASPWLFVGAVAVLAWRRPKLPWRQLLPFGLLALGYVFYIGWPALRFGFNWILVAATTTWPTTALAAQRFLQHGYYDLPLQTDLEGRDYTQHYWPHATRCSRSGPDQSSASRSMGGLGLGPALPASSRFMPTIGSSR